MVRIYDEARDLVRCSQTGTRVHGVRRVLAGGIDDFLVAAVARSAAATGGQATRTAR